MNKAGYIPVLRLRLQIRDIGPARTAAPFFRTSVGIPSTLVAFVFVNLFIMLDTSLAVTNFGKEKVPWVFET